MKAALLFAALFAAATASKWQVYEYYTYSYDYTTGYDCSTLVYVDMELVDDADCTEVTDCYSYSEFNYLRHCYDEDSMPAVDSFFTDYHLIVEWETEQCEGDPFEYMVFGKDICNWDADSYWIYWWECESFSGYMHEYYGYVSDGTCDSGYSSDYEPYSYYYYRIGGCFAYSSSGPWWTVTCDADSSSAGWQLITYYTALVDDATTCGTDELGYEFYYTDNCVAVDCHKGEDFFELWECQTLEPVPSALVPLGSTPIVVYYSGADDYTCSNDAITTFVWVDTCHNDGTYYYWFDFDYMEGTLTLEVTSDATCDKTAYYWGESTDYLPLYGYNGLLDYCFMDSSGAYSWYQITDGTAMSNYQTVYYYPTNTSNPYVQIDQWYANNCHEMNVAVDSYHDLYEVWVCNDVLTVPNLMDLMPEGLFMFYYDPSDSVCGTAPVWTSVMSQQCVNDTYANEAWYYDCYNQASTTVTLYRYDCSQGCDSYCYSNNIADSYGAGDASYCYQDYNQVYQYFTVHCSPPNPQWQVVEYYAAPNASVADTLVYVQAFYNDFCVNKTDTGDFFELWYCVDDAGSPQDYWTNAIYAYKYADSDCNATADYWEAFNPYCVTDVRDQTSWIFDCSKHRTDGSIELLQCGSAAANCMDSCYENYYWDGQLEDGYWTYTDYCYDDYYGYDTYFQLFCGNEAGYQVIDEFASNTNNDNYLFSREFSSYTTECNNRGVLGWNYYSYHMVEQWYCVVDEPDAYGVWADAMVIYDFDDDSYCLEANLDDISSFPRDCVNNEIFDESYIFNCQSDDDGVSLTVDTHTGADCADDTPYTTTWISSTYAGNGDNCWYESATDYFMLSCRPPNPAYQVVYYIANPTPDMDYLVHYMYGWSETCYNDSSVENGWTTVYMCQPTEPGAWDIWVNAVVYDVYSDSGCDEAGYLATEVYMPWENCLDLADGTSVSTTCIFDGSSQASLSLDTWSAAACTGTRSQVDVVDPWIAGDRAYCFMEWSEEFYYVLMCVPPNVQWQVMMVYTDDTETDALQSSTTISQFCYDYPGNTYSGGLWADYVCSATEPDWLDYYNSAPMEAVLYMTGDCSGNFTAKVAGTVDCATTSTMAYWGYCSPREGTISGYGCSTVSPSPFADCNDNGNDPTYSIYCDGSYLVYPSSTVSDGCFAMSYDGYSISYTMSCGDLTTNSVWWTTAELESEGECTMDSPIFATGYYTRFCLAATDGTCAPYDSLTYTFYENETCINQDELEGFGKGCVLMYTFDDSECAPEYTTGVALLHTGCWATDEDVWKADCSHTDGTITLSTGCDVGCGVCTTTDQVYTEDQCYAGVYETGSSYKCDATASAAALLLVAVLALLSVFGL